MQKKKKNATILQKIIKNSYKKHKKFAKKQKSVKKSRRNAKECEKFAQYR